LDLDFDKTEIQKMSLVPAFEEGSNVCLY